MAEKKLSYTHARGCHVEHGDPCTRGCAERAGYRVASRLLAEYLRARHTDLCNLGHEYAEEDRRHITDAIEFIVRNLAGV